MTLFFLFVLCALASIDTANVTQKVFFDFAINNVPIGRIIIGLFGNDLPKTTRNFLHYATTSRLNYGYQGSRIHRVVRNMMIVGGDFMRGDGSGSRSIFGTNFPDEGFLFSNTKPGLLLSQNSGANTNGCQFIITTVSANWLDQKNVVFGRVLFGLDVLKMIEEVPVNDREVPLKSVIIERSGLFSLSAPNAFVKAHDVTIDL